MTRGSSSQQFQQIQRVRVNTVLAAHLLTYLNVRSSRKIEFNSEDNSRIHSLDCDEWVGEDYENVSVDRSKRFKFNEEKFLSYEKPFLLLTIEKLIPHDVLHFHYYSLIAIKIYFLISMLRIYVITSYITAALLNVNYRKRLNLDVNTCVMRFKCKNRSAQATLIAAAPLVIEWQL